MHKNESWCSLLMPDKNQLEQHIRDVAVPAKSAADVDQYFRDVDFAAAARLSNSNVIIHSNMGWRCYTPEKDNCHELYQDMSRSSIFINCENRHFNVILGV